MALGWYYITTLHSASTLIVFFFCNFTELGFCEASNTSDVDRGYYIWEETEVGSSTQTPCAFGPSNEQATRECEKRNSWGEPQILMCATQVSLLFSEFNKSVVGDHRSKLRNKHTCTCHNSYAFDTHANENIAVVLIIMITLFRMLVMWARDYKSFFHLLVHVLVISNFANQKCKYKHKHPWT